MGRAAAGYFVDDPGFWTEAWLSKLPAGLDGGEGGGGERAVVAEAWSPRSMRRATEAVRERLGLPRGGRSGGGGDGGNGDDGGCDGVGAAGGMSGGDCGGTGGGKGRCPAMPATPRAVAPATASADPSSAAESAVELGAEAAAFLAACAAEGYSLCNAIAGPARIASGTGSPRGALRATTPSLWPLGTLPLGPTARETAAAVVAKTRDGVDRGFRVAGPTLSTLAGGLRRSAADLLLPLLNAANEDGAREGAGGGARGGGEGRGAGGCSEGGGVEGCKGGEALRWHRRLGKRLSVLGDARALRLLWDRRRGGDDAKELDDADEKSGEADEDDLEKEEEEEDEEEEEEEEESAKDGAAGAARRPGPLRCRGVQLADGYGARVCARVLVCVRVYVYMVACLEGRPPRTLLSSRIETS